MGHYKSNLRDIEFNLSELLERERIFGAEPYADVDLDTAKFILQEVDRLALERPRRVFRGGGREPAGLRRGDQVRDGHARVRGHLQDLDGCRIGGGCGCCPKWAAPMRRAR